jgi:antitoxin VapB
MSRRLGHFESNPRAEENLVHHKITFKPGLSSVWKKSICQTYTKGEFRHILAICNRALFYLAGTITMRTVSVFKNGNNRAIRLPRDLDFEGVNELEITREGDTILLRPIKPSWGSFLLEEKADADFMTEREEIVNDQGRVKL